MNASCVACNNSTESIWCSSHYQQPGHHPDDEWVYNRADIDGSNIVWARMWTAESNTKLTQYFANRRIWIAEPDAHPPRLTEKTRTELLAESAHIKTRH